MEQFAHLVETLATTPDGDGTLLDSSLLVHGTAISDSNTHFHDDLPITLVGGTTVGLRGGRHVRYAEGTPLANLWVTTLGMMDITVDTFGDSDGELDHLTDIA